MNEKELIVTFKWGKNVSNLLPTEINRIVSLAAQGLAKAAGDPISDITFEFAGKTHTVQAPAFANA